MRNFFVFIFFFLSANALAFEWEAGIRELFLTKQTYSYNSDSGSRIRRELFDRGYRRISLEPRIAWMSDQKSLFFLPPVKTPLNDIGVMNSRVSQADGKLTLRPLIYLNPDIGEAVPLDKIRPTRPELALQSYDQIMSQFTHIARTEEIDRLVVGSGIVHLLTDQKIHKKFEELLKGIRVRAGKKTDLILEVVGMEDLNALAGAVKADFPLHNLVDGVSLVLDPTIHFKDGTLNIESLRTTLISVESMIPGMPIHLSRIVVPACQNFKISGAEIQCDFKDRDQKLQAERFVKLKKSLLSLEGEGFSIATVEILEATTDFEPTDINPRYPYYNRLFQDGLIYELPKKPIVVAPPVPVLESGATKTACIYYDKNDLPPLTDRVGDIHSVMLMSVLGAFPDWKVKRERLKNYTIGSLKDCSALFYLGTNFLQDLPEGFAQEVATLSLNKPVVWFNYKFPFLSMALKNINQDPGFDANILMQPDSTPTPTNEDPGFFRFFQYKGEEFFKLAQWNPASDNFAASPELHLINIRNAADVKILSTARHSKNNQVVPYAVRNGNIWYMADSPFSFVHYEDRFYIFCDLLWDILGEKAPEERIALARIEDVGPNLDMNALRWAMDYLFQENVPFSLGVIPYYSDMIGSGGPDYMPVFKPITKYPSFVAQLRYAVARGADVVQHGSVHSVGQLISGYDGVSGGDYEFWLYPENRPLPFDSVEWVTRRLELGIKIFQELKITPSAFEVPHYAGSVLDYVIFSKFYRWNYHRTIYFPFSINVDTALPPGMQAFECDPKVCGDERRAILHNLRIEADYTAFGGMTLPFITYRDAYGQSLIPETLGMIDFAFYSPKTWRPVSKPEDILRRAKKLKVIRGAVASFFWHPQLLNSQSRYYQEVPGSFEKFGGKKSLELVIKGLRDLGYEFKSISDKSLFPEEESR